jgi:hypothetical protein
MKKLILISIVGLFFSCAQKSKEVSPSLVLMKVTEIIPYDMGDSVRYYLRYLPVDQQIEAYGVRDIPLSQFLNEKIGTDQEQYFYKVNSFSNEYEYFVDGLSDNSSW